MVDHDILVKIDTKLNILNTNFNNHLNTHAKYTYLAFSTLLGTIITLAIFIIKFT